MTAAHWFTHKEQGGFPVEKAALGCCDLSVLPSATSRPPCLTNHSQFPAMCLGPKRFPAPTARCLRPCQLQAAELNLLTGERSTRTDTSDRVALKGPGAQCPHFPGPEGARGKYGVVTPNDLPAPALPLRRMCAFPARCRNYRLCARI
jgi:hypothetical protein